MDIAIPIFSDFTALDAIGPYEVPRSLPEARVTFVAAVRGVVRTEDRMAGLHADAAFAATTHWATADLLETTGARYTPERVARQGKIFTGAGVSAGIDLALTPAAEIAGEDVANAIQPGTEYGPRPPFDAGSPAKAGRRIMELTGMVEAEPVG